MGVFHVGVSYEKWAKKKNKRRKEEEWKALKGRDRKFSKDRKQSVGGWREEIEGESLLLHFRDVDFLDVSKLELLLLGI